MNAAHSLTPEGHEAGITDGERGAMPSGPDLLAAGRHPLTSIVQDRLQDRCAVPEGSALVIGVSGGSDSVALLLACAAMRDRSGDGLAVISPTVVHVHHHLRDSADDDARFVQALCESLQIPCRIAHVNPAALRGNVAANARRLRYDQLAIAAIDAGARFIAVAHQADDQLETMLMALCRDGGVSRLGGLRWRRRLRSTGAAADLWLVRPLLEATHADCADLCRAAGIAWREDPTNQDVSTARGRLRRDVLPVLRSMWPGCAARSTMLAAQLGAAHEALERELDRVFGPPTQRSWPRQSLGNLPRDFIAAGLRRALSCDDLASSQRSPNVARTLGLAARSIASTNPQPRKFAIGSQCVLFVTERDVHIDYMSRSEQRH
jgi:tRNA(Ile)-lysidine synthetase-like protein